VLLHDRLEALGRCRRNPDLDADVSVLDLRHEIGMVLGLLIALIVVVEELRGPPVVPDELAWAEQLRAAVLEPRGRPRDRAMTSLERLRRRPQRLA
jgi:hypothetical protein